jgi:hypothetical protein
MGETVGKSRRASSSGTGRAASLGRASQNHGAVEVAARQATKGGWIASTAPLSVLMADKPALRGNRTAT